MTSPIGHVEPPASCVGEPIPDCLAAWAQKDITVDGLCPACTTLLMTAVDWATNRDNNWAETWKAVA